MNNIKVSVIDSLSNRKGLRRVLAAVFLLLFLAEFGSHGAICLGEFAAHGQAATASERGHEDPCATLIQCGYDRQNREAPKLGHDALQHNGLVDGLFELSTNVWLREEPPIAPDVDDRIFRPKEPPFHPPKTS